MRFLSTVLHKVSVGHFDVLFDCAGSHKMGVPLSSHEGKSAFFLARDVGFQS